MLSRQISNHLCHFGTFLTDQKVVKVVPLGEAETVVRKGKIVEMGLVRVAQAIAEGKVKVTVADLDRLIRLEEFLRQESEDERPKVIIEWRDCDHTGKLKDKAGDEDDASTTPAEEED